MVSRFIRKQLISMKHTQVDLADHLGVTKQTLHYKLSNDVWTVKELAIVADFFGIKLYELIIESI